MNKYIFFIFLTSCSFSKKQTWVDGCSFGTITTLENLYQEPAPPSVKKAVSMQCGALHDYNYEK